MREVKKVIFTDAATASGGRAGHVKSSNGTIDLPLAMPTEESFVVGKHANPEELFAAAYAACFDGAINAVAGMDGVELADTETNVEIDFGKTEDGFGIAARITASIKGVSKDKAQELLDKAHLLCPYSNATRGNIAVDLKLI